MASSFLQPIAIRCNPMVFELSEVTRSNCNSTKAASTPLDTAITRNKIWWIFRRWNSKSYNNKFAIKMKNMIFRCSEGNIALRIENDRAIFIRSK